MSLSSDLYAAARRLACFAAIATLSVLPAPCALAQTMVVTIDDASFLHATPRLSASARNQALLDALARHQVSAALFITGGFGADKPAGYAMAKAWGDAGHAIANHTMTHSDFNLARVTLDQYRRELLDCDKLIASLPGYQKWFRFPFLHEGETIAKRQGMRDALSEAGYLSADVDMDTLDWEFDDKLMAALKRQGKADVAQVKQAYLDHARARALALRDKVRAMPGEARPQVLLLHHNLLNALWLDELLSIFKEQGWRFAAPQASTFSALALTKVAGKSSP